MQAAPTSLCAAADRPRPNRSPAPARREWCLGRPRRPAHRGFAHCPDTRHGRARRSLPPGGWVEALRSWAKGLLTVARSSAMVRFPDPELISRNAEQTACAGRLQHRRCAARAATGHTAASHRPAPAGANAALRPRRRGSMPCRSPRAPGIPGGRGAAQHGEGTVMATSATRPQGTGGALVVVRGDPPSPRRPTARRPAHRAAGRRQRRRPAHRRPESKGR